MDDGLYMRKNNGAMAVRVMPSDVDVSTGEMTFGDTVFVQKRKPIRQRKTISPRHVLFVRKGGLSILTLNVQFYKVISTLYNNMPGSRQGTYQAFGETILEYLPDVVCLQEDLYPRPHSLGLDKFYTQVVHCAAEYLPHLGAHLANTILVRKSRDLLVSDSGAISLERYGTARCASYVKVNGIKIANTHLQGGRFADMDYTTLMNTKAREIVQIVQDIGPDVIVGDFNGDKRAQAESTLQLHPVFEDLSTEEKKQFLNYFSGVHDTLADIGYTSAYEAKDVGHTSIFGGVPDWVYVNPLRVDVMGDGLQVVSETLKEQLSDHAGVIVEVQLKSYMSHVK
jgi:endonuclease/exonuclease/phosphatase family metal-dependent hydrolase